MRIAQILLPDASAFDRKCQRIDAAGLGGAHEVLQVGIEEAGDVAADIIHLYGTPPARPRITRPYVATREIPVRRFALRRQAPPRAVLTPFEVPEAVEDDYFLSEVTGRHERQPSPTIGSYFRPAVRNMIDLTLSRIARFRDDVSWKLFDTPPSPADLQGVDAWVDPAVNDDDYEGFTAEALVSGIAVVASRTPLNNLRLEKSRTGFLVPCKDPNELTHAILSALFKLEVAERKIEAARGTAAKFRPRQRLRSLLKIYESIVQ